MTLVPPAGSEYAGGFATAKVASGGATVHTKKPRSRSLPITLPLGKNGHTFHSPLNCALSEPG